MTFPLSDEQIMHTDDQAVSTDDLFASWWPVMPDDDQMMQNFMMSKIMMSSVLVG